MLTKTERWIMFGFFLGMAAAVGVGVYAYFTYRPPQGDKTPLSRDAMRYVHDQAHRQQQINDL